MRDLIPIDDCQPKVKLLDTEEVMVLLNCDKMKANKLIDEANKHYGFNRYGVIEEHLLLDYLEHKKRLDNEREARYASNIANVEKTGLIKEQVAVLKEMVSSAKADALEAKREAAIARWLAILSIIATIVSAFIAKV